MTLKERIKNEMMVIKALGVVYGDIGTSPIYTLAVIFLIIPPTVCEYLWNFVICILGINDFSDDSIRMVSDEFK